MREAAAPIHNCGGAEMLKLALRSPITRVRAREAAAQTHGSAGADMYNWCSAIRSRPRIAVAESLREHS